MEVRLTPLSGVFELNAPLHTDERGGFTRAYCRDALIEAGVTGFNPLQANLSWNHSAFTLRGLHFQPPPKAEAKLVRVVSGSAFDVAVDLREDSPTFLRWHGTVLNSHVRNALYIPEGCAHGFLTLAPNTELLYLMGRVFEPGFDRGFRWDDPTFGIEWPATPAVISDRDAQYPDYVQSVMP